MQNHHLAALGICAVLTLTGAHAAQAQDDRPAREPGVMLGPMMMGVRGFGMLCSPQAVGFAEWQLSRVAQSVKPTREQSEKLAELRSASAKATDTIKAACPNELPRTAPERMALMEKRVGAMLEAVKTVRPAFEGFYRSLTAEQRAKLDGTSSRRWGWGWRFWERGPRS
jgi:hypothetical protein